MPPLKLRQAKQGSELRVQSSGFKAQLHDCMAALLHNCMTKKKPASAGVFSIAFAFHVMCMEQFMSQMAVGFSEEFPVNSYHIRIFV